MSKLATIVAAGTIALGSTVMAVDVGPGDLAGSKAAFSAPHGTGTNPFAYDWDSAAPQVTAGAPTGYGSNSFYANVDATGATPADRYRTFRIGVQDLFANDSSVTIGDIASIDYQTNKNDSQTQGDWRLTIYTTPGDKAVDTNDLATGTGDRASWYRNRIQSQPEESDNLNAPANTWNLWSTDAGANSQNFYTNRSGFTAHDISWSELTAGNVTRGPNVWDFSGEEIMMIDITLGANSGGWTVASALDAVRITHVTEGTADINLVPEPSAFALLGLGAGALLLRRRRQRN